MKTKRYGLFSLLFLSVLQWSAQAATLSIANVRGYPGQPATVPVNLRGASNQVVAAQFDVAFNNSKVTWNDVGLASRLPRKLAAIMFTEMVNYSGLAQRDEAFSLELLEKHRGLVRGVLPKHGGCEIKPFVTFL